MRTKQEILKFNRIIKSGRKLSDEEFAIIYEAISEVCDQMLFDLETEPDTSSLNEMEHYISLEIRELIPDRVFINEERLRGPVITIPDAYTQIASHVFIDRKDIVEVVLPDGITVIQRQAFCNCTNLKSINIPDSVKEIHEAAFKGCMSLDEIYIPARVTCIDVNVFKGCTKLQNIFVDVDNLLYTDVDGVLFNKDKTKLIRYPEGKAQSSFVVPVSVREIAHNAFSGCDYIKSLYFPAG